MRKLNSVILKSLVSGHLLLSGMSFAADSGATHTNPEVIPAGAASQATGTPTVGAAEGNYEMIAKTADKWATFTPATTSIRTLQADQNSLKVCLNRQELQDVSKWVRRIAWFRKKVVETCIPSDASAEHLVNLLDNCIAAAPPTAGALHTAFANGKEVFVDGNSRCEVQVSLVEMSYCRAHIDSYFQTKRNNISAQRKEEIGQWRTDWEILDKSSKLFALFLLSQETMQKMQAQVTEGMTRIDNLGKLALEKLGETDIGQYCQIDPPAKLATGTRIQDPGPDRRPAPQPEQVVADQPYAAYEPAPQQGYQKQEYLPQGKGYIYEPNYDPTKFDYDRDYGRGMDYFGGDYGGGKDYVSRGNNYQPPVQYPAQQPFVQQPLPVQAAPAGGFGFGFNSNRGGFGFNYGQQYMMPGISSPALPPAIPIAPFGVSASVSDTPRGREVNVAVSTPFGTANVGLNLGMPMQTNKNVCFQKGKPCPRTMAMGLGFPSLFPGTMPFPMPWMQQYQPQNPWLVGSIPSRPGTFPYNPPTTNTNPSQTVIPVSRNTGQVPRVGSIQ